MEAILDLSYEQQDELLALCKEFFPAYNDFYLAELLISDKSHIQYTLYDYITFHGESNGYANNQCMHWYQLCLTELSARIWKKISPEETYTFYFPYDKKELRIDTLQELKIQLLLSKHPVDFLFHFVKRFKS